MESLDALKIMGRFTPHPVCVRLISTALPSSSLLYLSRTKHFPGNCLISRFISKLRSVTDTVEGVS